MVNGVLTGNPCSPTQSSWSLNFGSFRNYTPDLVNPISRDETRTSNGLRRIRRHDIVFSPPRILPDLPNLVRFFDRTGLQIQCRAAGNPSPIIRWFSLPTTNTRPSQAVTGPASSNSEHSGTRSLSSESRLGDVQMNDDLILGELGYDSQAR
ncbi:hypothetical protein P879_09516 [Paragonimus westermani]|uniref:Ig-like domain-containing protein n=1 Tax=Paragonimus westermani TaxID=34504 RepID=A0A8T0DNP3_9TREM|nr:hypothetical protein P879_09516 [Paragonimus westermani]